MEHLITRILVPSDFSESSDAALEYARMLSRAPGGTPRASRIGGAWGTNPRSTNRVSVAPIVPVAPHAKITARSGVRSLAARPSRCSRSGSRSGAKNDSTRPTSPAHWCPTLGRLTVPQYFNRLATDNSSSSWRYPSSVGYDAPCSSTHFERSMSGFRRTSLRIMSGYNEEMLADRTASGPTEAFIQKPFTPVMLARKVREILDRRA